MTRLKEPVDYKVGDVVVTDSHDMSPRLGFVVEVEARAPDADGDLNQEITVHVWPDEDREGEPLTFHDDEVTLIVRYM